MHPPGLVLCWKLECSDRATQCCWPPPGLTEVPETHVAGILVKRQGECVPSTLGSLDLAPPMLLSCHGEFHQPLPHTSFQPWSWGGSEGLGCCCSPLPGLILCNLLSFSFLLPTPSYSVIYHQKERLYLIYTRPRFSKCKKKTLFSWKGQQH